MSVWYNGLRNNYKAKTQIRSGHNETAQNSENLQGGGVNYRVAFASNSDSHDAARAAFSVAAPFCFTLPPRLTTKG